MLMVKSVKMKTLQKWPKVGLKVLIGTCWKLSAKAEIGVGKKTDDE